MTIRKTIALTVQTFVSKVMSLLFSTLSKFVTAFLPRSKCLLISWLQSLSMVILVEPKENENAGLKLSIQKTKIMASGHITSRQIDGETMETVTDCCLGLQNHCEW